MIISVRYTIHGFATVPFLFNAASRLPSISFSHWTYCILGGLTCGATSYVANYSYHYIPLLDSFVLCNSQPVFAAIIAWLWLKEKLALYDLGIIILTLVGVVIACQPTFIFGNEIDDIDPISRAIGSAYGVATAIFMAITTCITRKVKTTPSQLVVYMQGIGGVVIGFVGGLAMGQLFINPGITDVQIVALVFAGILGFIARCLFAFAVQTEEATLISVIQTMEIPFSFIVQLVMLNTYPNSLSVIGAIIVMVGTALLAAKKNVKNKAKFLRDSFKERIRPIIVKRNNIKYDDTENQPVLVARDIGYGTKG